MSEEKEILIQDTRSSGYKEITITLPNNKKEGYPVEKKIISPFWNQLFFWVTIITSVKLWLSHRRLMTKDKVLITINGIEYYAKHITVHDGHMFLDGKYVGPEDIDDIRIIEG